MIPLLILLLLLGLLIVASNASQNNIDIQQDPLGHIIKACPTWPNEFDDRIGLIPFSGEIVTWNSGGIGVVVQGSIYFTREEYEKRKS